MMRWRAATVLGLALLLSAPVGVHAHAFLDRADPRVGSTVKTPPTRVRLWFTQRLEAAFCTVQVLNEAGQQVDRKDMRPEAANPALLVVSLPALGPGRYTVLWRVLSVDSHVTNGDFTFRVAP